MLSGLANTVLSLLDQLRISYIFIEALVRHLYFSLIRLVDRTNLFVDEQHAASISSIEVSLTKNLLIFIVYHIK